VTIALYKLTFAITIDIVLQVMVAALVHLKDEYCTAESHVFSQFVRTPHHKPHDMKVLLRVSYTDSLTNGVVKLSQSTDFLS